nr:MAG TPA: hypothetical protein [Caudoviricetes sp.]
MKLLELKKKKSKILFLYFLYYENFRRNFR